MNFWHQRVFLIIASLVFLVLAPVLVVLSLGYDTNLNKTLTIRIESYPRGGQVLVDNQFVANPPTEILVKAGLKTEIKVKRDEFIDEKFWLWGNANQNSTAIINNLWLLPAHSFGPGQEGQTDNNQNLDIQNLQILSESLILSRSKTNQLFWRGYTTNGIENSLIPIEIASFKPPNQPFNFFNPNPNNSSSSIDLTSSSSSSKSQSKDKPTNQSKQSASSTNNSILVTDNQNQTSSQVIEAEPPTETFQSINTDNQQRNQKYQQKIANLSSDDKWLDLEYDAFWNRDEQLLIYFFDNKWQILDLTFNQSPFITASKIANNQVLLLRQDGTLWLINLDIGSLDFIDTGFQGMSFTTAPENVWLWKDNTLYTLSRGVIDLKTFNLRPYFQNTLLTTQAKELKKQDKVLEIKANSLKVRSLFQGLGVKFGNQLIYIPDIDSNRWQYIANQVVEMNTDGNSVFWLDLNNYLITKNLFLDNINQLGQVIDIEKIENFSMYFSVDWSRLMLYNQQSVSSIWVAKDSLNTNIKSFSYNLWLNNLYCFNRTNNSRQYCLDKDGNLLIYKNSRIF